MRGLHARGIERARYRACTHRGRVACLACSVLDLVYVYSVLWFLRIN